MSIPEVGKFLTDRVKAGEIRPTFFCPVDSPVDNSILPDLELTLPARSVSAGFRMPSIGTSPLESCPNGQERMANYRRFDPVGTAGFNPILISAPDGRAELELEYNNPQISACSGRNTLPGGDTMTVIDYDLEYNRPQISATAGRRAMAMDGMTPIDFDLDYNRPQISATAGRRAMAMEGMTPVDFDLEYNRPQVSATSGRSTLPGEGLTPIDYDFGTKLEGSQSVVVTPKMSAIYRAPEVQPSSSNITETRLGMGPYVVPSNTHYQAPNSVDHRLSFREKQHALSSYRPQGTLAHIPRAGITDPNTRVKFRKDR
jgi:hypothetical protein